MADCVSYKIDSNVTGLAFAEEVCAKQLPTLADDGHDPTWFELEPNEYDDFGADITLLARTPLSRTRQRKKGTPTDLDAVAGWNEDLTQHNLNRLLQGFFFANFHEKATTFPMNADVDGDQVVITGVVASNDRFTAASGMTRFRVGQLIFVSGCVNGANNGLKTVDEVAAGYVGVAESLTDEAGSDNIVITVVGEVLTAEDASITLAGNVGTLTLATIPDTAFGTLSIASGQNAIANETVTIGGVVYTFKAAAAAAHQVTIGADRLSTLTNLAATINGGSVFTVEHPTVTATDNGDGTMDVTAKIAGTTGNLIATTETMTQGSWGAATLASGAGFSFLSLGLTVGEWFFVGGDEAGSYFDDQRGYARVKAITDTTIIMDKTTFDAAVDDGTDVTLKLFLGSYLRNEPAGDDVVTHYYQFERSLGRDADGPQAEYVLGAVANELTLNFDTADKLTVDLGFIAADANTRTGAEGLKDGDRRAALGEDAFNTTSDVVRMRMSLIDETDSMPSALFGYVTEGELTIANNVSPVKVIGALGGVDVSVGNFDVGGSVTALFSNVLAIRAIRASSDVTIDLIFAKLNHGYVWDMPLITLGNGQPDISENDPVTIPLDMIAAQNPAGYTASYTNFDYLPTAAMPVAI